MEDKIKAIDLGSGRSAIITTSQYTSATMTNNLGTKTAAEGNTFVIFQPSEVKLVRPVMRHVDGVGWHNVGDEVIALAYSDIVALYEAGQSMSSHEEVPANYVDDLPF